MASARSEQKLPFKPRVKREERRALIEQAASRLIAERGYDGASLEEIARSAGISKAVLYDHFGSKAELQIDLLKQNTEALMAFTAERVVAAEGPEQRFRVGVEAFFEFVESHDFAWRLIFRDPPTDPAVAEACNQMHRWVTQSIAALFRTEPRVAELIDQGGGPEEIEMMAEQIKMAMGGLASWWYDHRDLAREQMVESMMNVFWVGIERLADGERWEGRKAGSD